MQEAQIGVVADFVVAQRADGAAVFFEVGEDGNFGDGAWGVGSWYLFIAERIACLVPARRATAVNPSACTA